MDDLDSESRKRSIIVYAGAVAVLLVLYVLSLGPVWWLLENTEFFTNETVYNTAVNFYAPLAWVCELTDGAGQLIERYVSLWTK